MTTHASSGWHAGPLQALLEVPGVTDVLVNAPDEVWIDRGVGLERADASFVGAGDVRELAVRLASLGGRRLDDASPVVDARLPDGTRLHAAIPPVADGCTAISLRAVRGSSLAIDDMVLAGTCTPRVAERLRALVEARASLLVTGATGTGKTTLVTSLLALVSPAERIVVIEEAGEIYPDHPHVVRLVERRANVDGAGAVSVAALVREALRMRPDRIVLGECRGAEVREVLTALNTGHRGGMATMHANAPQDVPARLIALGALAGMDARATVLHAAAAFDAVVHLDKTLDGPSCRRHREPRGAARGARDRTRPRGRRRTRGGRDRGGGVSGASAELMAAAALVRAGIAPGDAWDQASGVAPPPAAAAALRLARHTGAPLADVLERVAAAAREAERVEADRDAAMAGPRASARLLQWLPLAGVGLAGVLEPSALRLLVATPLGWGLAGTGAALAWLGRRWMRALVARAALAGRDLERATLTMALVEAAVTAGKDVVGACAAAGAALRADGAWLERVAERLAAGEPWARAWSDVAGDPVAVALEGALRAPWTAGASPVPALRAACEVAADDARAAATRATGTLEAHSALPLAMCLLPAFVVAGVVPLVIAVAAAARAAP